jgi:hypothetical protein
MIARSDRCGPVARPDEPLASTRRLKTWPAELVAVNLLLQYKTVEACHVKNPSIYPPAYYSCTSH